MTPKEKAEELVLKYLGLQEPNYNWFNKTLAKQCALIAVDEILSMGIMADSKDWNMAKEYWQEVKQEINNL
jgi:hypothetical protein